jgi:hypothetical protein
LPRVLADHVQQLRLGHPSGMRVAEAGRAACRTRKQSRLDRLKLDWLITVGVDLSAVPEKQRWCGSTGSPSGARVRDLVVGATDELITQAVMEADKAGIDCPLGWPEKFVEFISVHHTGNVVVPAEVAGRDWRRTLAYRATDKAVRDITHLVPLSVAADRIAHTAMRCAGLLAQLAHKGQPVDRCGTGVVSRSTQPRRSSSGTCRIAAIREGVTPILSRKWSTHC